MGKFLLINTYFPSVKNHIDECIVQTIIDEIDAAINRFPSSIIIWGGDFNVDLIKTIKSGMMLVDFFY